jgi:ParB family chromosome partitioning protein
MMKTVHVKDIKPNPFQVRTTYSQESIDQLADEIKTTGLWTGALRGRAVNGSVELCFGHRRLAAIKKLGWKTVEVEIADLDDQQMAAQSLIENLQREGLNDVDKADGIRQLVDLLSTNGSVSGTHRQVAEMLGFSESSIQQWLQLSEFNRREKNLIRKGKIAGKTALEANRIGGAAMVQVAADQGLTRDHLQRLNKELKDIPDDKIRAQVTKSVIAGKATTPEKVQQKARQLKARTQKEEPPDLLLIITNWTGFIREWTTQLQEVQPYIEYIDKVPRIADKFRASVRALISALEKLL